MNITTKTQQDQKLTLVLGGTGKTGRRVAERLASRGVPTRIASRSGAPSFDWNDKGTWGAALDGVTAAYITYAPDLAIPGATDAIREFVKQRVAPYKYPRIVQIVPDALPKSGTGKILKKEIRKKFGTGL